MVNQSVNAKCKQAHQSSVAAYLEISSFCARDNGGVPLHNKHVARCVSHINFAGHAQKADPLNSPFPIGPCEGVSPVRRQAFRHRLKPLLAYLQRPSH